MAIKPISVKPMAAPAGSAVNFGAVIDNVDLGHLSGRFLI